MNIRVHFVMALALVALSGCGQKGPSTSSESARESAGEQARTADASGVRTIEITANDQMRFSVATIDARPGESLRVVLRNTGVAPKEAMGHNWVLLRAGANVMSFAASAAGARDTQYIPPALKDQVLASTPLLGPREVGEAVFKAPEQPGTYPFLCSFPGHAALMKGTLTVK